MIFSALFDINIYSLNIQYSKNLLFSMPNCSCGYIQEDKKLAWSYTTSDQKETCRNDFSDWIYVMDKYISQLLNLFLGPSSHPPIPSNGS